MGLHRSVNRVDGCNPLAARPIASSLEAFGRRPRRMPRRRHGPASETLHKNGRSEARRGIRPRPSLSAKNTEICCLTSPLEPHEAPHQVSVKHALVSFDYAVIDIEPLAVPIERPPPLPLRLVKRVVVFLAAKTGLNALDP